MVAERVYTKTSDNVFDGEKGKAFEDYHFDLLNQLTYQAMVGKSDKEREAASMMQILETSEAMTPDQAKNVTHQGTEDEKRKAKYANELLSAILALNTAGTAKQIVKDFGVTERLRGLGQVTGQT